MASSPSCNRYRSQQRGQTPSAAEDPFKVHSAADPSEETNLIIKTTDGKDVLVDDEDYDLLSQHSWSASTGYARRSVMGASIAMHRQLMHPAQGLVVDHKNGNPLDNRKDNLRVVTQRENSRNRGPSKTNRLGHLGVAYDHRFGLFAAYIEREILGHFATLEEAVEARLTEERKRWGVQPRREAAFNALG
ncbi:HNH endonuclease signature motif containing protein [Brevundimonas sp. NPDC090276]|uniref:HNH endonuclease signature motif containing protein n=1 Tax=Brevundimonas sp. NPDC090276 TaxID=3363956 RepID=UPI00383B7A5A